MNQSDCTYCGKEQDLPFQCNYCGDKFCSEHRLPEAHKCVNLHQIKSRKFGRNSMKRNMGKGKKVGLGIGIGFAVLIIVGVMGSYLQGNPGTPQQTTQSQQAQTTQIEQTSQQPQTSASLSTSPSLPYAKPSRVATIIHPGANNQQIIERFTSH